MAKTKVIQALRSQKAKNFLEDLSVAGNTYMFTAKPTAWTNDRVFCGNRKCAYHAL